MIDPILIRRKISLISQDFEEVSRLAERSPEEFLADKMSQVLAERYLERMIGRMIDINYHIVTEEGKPPPRDYYLSFVELSALGILSPEFAREIARSAGLRNRLVHEYDEIDPAKLFEGMRASAKDTPIYLEQILKFIRGRE